MVSHCVPAEGAQLARKNEKTGKRAKETLCALEIPETAVIRAWARPCFQAAPIVHFEMLPPICAF